MLLDDTNREFAEEVLENNIYFSDRTLEWAENFLDDVEKIDKHKYLVRF